MPGRGPELIPHLERGSHALCHGYRYHGRNVYILTWLQGAAPSREVDPAEQSSGDTDHRFPRHSEYVTLRMINLC